MIKLKKAGGIISFIAALIALFVTFLGHDRIPLELFFLMGVSAGNIPEEGYYDYYFAIGTIVISILVVIIYETIAVLNFLMVLALLGGIISLVGKYYSSAKSS